jgi:ADP-ribose pyrophosphatase YjhB (NUDIX family)
MSKIRPLAIALIKNEKNQLLLHEGYDSVKNEKFYRPLGGGIEFGERGAQALVREFEEEINQKIVEVILLNVFENIFTYEGKQSHEIVLVYAAKLVSAPQQSYEINESGKVVGNAVWRSLEEIRAQNAKIYPDGIETVI